MKLDHKILKTPSECKNFINSLGNLYETFVFVPSTEEYYVWFKEGTDKNFDISKHKKSDISKHKKSEELILDEFKILEQAKRKGLIKDNICFCGATLVNQCTCQINFSLEEIFSCIQNSFKKLGID